MAIGMATPKIEDLETQNDMLREALKATQWGFNHARCPVCAGFDGETERDYTHNETCIVWLALQDTN